MIFQPNFNNFWRKSFIVLVFSLFASFNIFSQSTGTSTITGTVADPRLILAAAIKSLALGLVLAHYAKHLVM